MKPRKIEIRQPNRWGRTRPAGLSLPPRSACSPGVGGVDAQASSDVSNNNAGPFAMKRPAGGALSDRRAIPVYIVG